MNQPNVRITRKIRTEQGAIIRTEVGGSWFSPPISLDYIKRQLADFQSEEPQAGWTLEYQGTERNWHAEVTV